VVRELAIESHCMPPDRKTADEILSIIISHVRDVVPELAAHPFTPHDRLADLGANSIDRAEIVAMTLSSLALRIPMVATTRARNLGELAELLHEEL
jgi:polyketide biosynthesis acyl carrier protein